MIFHFFFHITVIGALIGKQSGRNVEVMNSFELKFKFVNQDIIICQDYYRTKEEQCKYLYFKPHKIWICWKWFIWLFSFRCFFFLDTKINKCSKIWTFSVGIPLEIGQPIRMLKCINKYVKSTSAQLCCNLVRNHEILMWVTFICRG